MNSTQLGHEIGRILAMVASDDLTLNQAADEAQSAIDEFEKGANEAIAPLQSSLSQREKQLADALDKVEDYKRMMAQEQLTINDLEKDKQRMDWIETANPRQLAWITQERYRRLAINSAIQNEKGKE